MLSLHPLTLALAVALFAPIACRASVVEPPPCLQTRTPYPAPPPSLHLSPAPAGYQVVFTEMVARHGSRGLTGMKGDLALANLLDDAHRSGGLTPLGEGLRPLLRRLMQAHATLGIGEPGITRPGYGNLSRQGVAEHRGLAQRMLGRLPTLWAQHGVITVQTSGVDRAIDSAKAFTTALTEARPELASDLKDLGSARFLLYFHKLDPQRDPLPEGNDLAAHTLADSLAYQAYLARDPGLATLMTQGKQTPDMRAASEAVLQALFTPGFFKELAAGQHPSANTGTRLVWPMQGWQPVTLTGDGHTRLQTPEDVALALYELYAISPLLTQEVRVDLSPYMPREAACRFEAVLDAEDFFAKGPGQQGLNGVTHRMARGLIDALLQAAEQAAAHPGRERARLLFAHAETLMPLAAALGLPGSEHGLSVSQPQAVAQSGWQAAKVAPMAANLQWDVFRNARGHALVRPLYNERPVALPRCLVARLPGHPDFYELTQLRSCLLAR